MRFAILFIAASAVSAIQLEKSYQPEQTDYKNNMLKKAGDDHAVLMSHADDALAKQKAGVAASAADIAAYKASHRWTSMSDW